MLLTDGAWGDKDLVNALQVTEKRLINNKVLAFFMIVYFYFLKQLHNLPRPFFHRSLTLETFLARLRFKRLMESGSRILRF